MSVVITTYNHAHFLADAIDSVRAQSHPAAEIIIVDDGSTDDVASVTARYPDVKLIRQPNQGLAAARNRGLREASADKVIFLDADDRLLAGAVAEGLACFEGAPASGFVYGGYRRVVMNGHLRSDNYYNPIGNEPYRSFLKGNLIGMHAAVMYDRERLLACGGFDRTLPRCEDYDVYLRMSRTTPVASHPAVVAEYRWHGRNMSSNHREMLHWTLRVQQREAAHALGRDETSADWRRGRARARDLYVGRILEDARVALVKQHSLARVARSVADAIVASPGSAARQLLDAARRLVMRSAIRRRQRAHGEAHSNVQARAPRVGSVSFGDLNRVTPISAQFGFDRGTPIDRRYIEAFLGRHADDIAGRVLEVGGDEYCRRFGGSRISRQDILNLSAENEHATIVGDLSHPQTLPEAAFDCLVLTQTLQYIFDVRAAVVEMHRALTPGGVLLLTVPGVSQIERGAPAQLWCWSFTARGVMQLFAEVFGAGRVAVESHGNVYAATAFLHGLAVEDVDTSALDVNDPLCPVIVAVRAQKAASNHDRDTETDPPAVR